MKTFTGFGLRPQQPNSSLTLQAKHMGKILTTMVLDSVEKKVSPVWQFIFLLAPTVMTGFYLVYALVGLVIEGPNKLKWSDEALEVGVFVTFIILVMNVLVMAYAWYHKLRITHLLWVSPLTHLAIAFTLTAMIWLID